MKKKKLKRKIENLHNMLNKTRLKVKNQKNEITSLLQQKKELKIELASANNYIFMLERQLEIQDIEIIRKDERFLGLTKAYQDEIINKG